MGPLTRPFSDAGLSSSGLVSKWATGLSFPSMGKALKGAEFGQSCPMGKGWAATSGPAVSYRERPGPSQAQPFESGLILKACPLNIFGCSKGCNLELEFARFCEK